MELLIDGIPVTVTHKRIKNMHLYVKAPDGRVEVTAPMRTGRETITGFVHTNIGWVRKKQEEIVSRPQPEACRYESGESLYLWGKRYELRVACGSRYGMSLDKGTAYLTVREGSSQEQRERYVNEWYRGILKARIAERLPLIEERTDLHCSGWQTKNMTTRWGTCNTRTKKIWLNLQLVKWYPVCLDYVILHELVHTKVKNHGPDFAAMMDQLMPEWRKLRAALNAGEARDQQDITCADQ